MKTESVKRLREWSNWACGADDAPTRFRVAKAREQLCPTLDNQISRCGWAALIWAAKSLCDRLSLEHEGWIVDNIIARALVANPAALRALCLSACGGAEAAELLIPEN